MRVRNSIDVLDITANSRVLSSLLDVGGIFGGTSVASQRVWILDTIDHGFSPFRRYAYQSLDPRC